MILEYAKAIGNVKETCRDFGVASLDVQRPLASRGTDCLCRWRAERADIEYVRILHLAASTLESRVERALVELLAGGKSFDYAQVKAVAAPALRVVPHVAIPAPDLAAYDRLLGGAR